MKVFKSIRVKDAVKQQIELEEALEKIKTFNKEFCEDKSDEQLIKEMKISPIHTNLNKYWIEE
jgi:hypothetical protein